MLPPFDPWRTAEVAAELTLTTRAPPAWRTVRARHRLASLLAHARSHSPFWRDRLAGVDPSRTPLPTLPVLHKTELMANFDAAVCDPRLRLQDLRTFLADPRRIGEGFGVPGMADTCTVWESSGSTGEPAVFVQDAGAMAVYDALEAWRRSDWTQWLRPSWNTSLVFLGATGGHFASTVSVERLRRLNPWLAPHLHSVGFLQPWPRILEQLNALRPDVIATYPSAAAILADERQRGRLRASPRAIWTGGETLTAASRRHIEQAFGCPVRDSYGASEFLCIAAACAHGHLHVNDDWVLLEPVDERGRPVPAGETGASVLLTNLANALQPLIRYDLGDRVSLHEGRCACGSTLPVVRVEGRIDDTLALEGDDGRPVRLLPLALCTLLEDDAGVYDFQLRRAGPRELELRLGDAPGLPEAAGVRAAEVLRCYLGRQGASGVQVQVSLHRAGERGRSGKVPRVVAGT